MRLLIFVARFFHLVAGLAAIGVLVVGAMHLSPVVIHESETEATVLDPSWGLVGIFTATAIGSWAIAYVLASIAAWRINRQMGGFYDL
jgi:hypothetical protein